MACLLSLQVSALHHYPTRTQNVVESDTSQYAVIIIYHRELFTVPE